MNLDRVAWGKFIATASMFVSILMVALPTSILGSNFTNEWNAYHQQQTVKKLRARREHHKQHREDTENIRELKEQNSTLLKTLAEIQEKLDGVRTIICATSQFIFYV